jgi:hypothetical protein
MPYPKGIAHLLLLVLAHLDGKAVLAVPAGIPQPLAIAGQDDVTEIIHLFLCPGIFLTQRIIRLAL